MIISLNFDTKMDQFRIDNRGINYYSKYTFLIHDSVFPMWSYENLLVNI